MLVVYTEETGMINQCIILAQVTLEELAERYKAINHPCVLVDIEDPLFINTCYVKDGVVVPKPEIAMSGENRPVKADGVDTLEFQIEPVNAEVSVIFNGVTIHEESVTDGKIEFSTDQVGSYTIGVSAVFPYNGLVFNVEAVDEA